MLRYALTKLAINIPGGSTHWGTLAANCLGCFAIGLLAGLLSSGLLMSDHHQVAVRTGFLGGLTTFSTFAMETVGLASDHRWSLTLAYAAANLTLGLLAVVFGLWLGKAIFPTAT